MQVIRDSSIIPKTVRNCVVALGNFDGLVKGATALAIGAAAKLGWARLAASRSRYSDV